MGTEIKVNEAQEREIQRQNEINQLEQAERVQENSRTLEEDSVIETTNKFDENNVKPEKNVDASDDFEEDAPTLNEQEENFAIETQLDALDQINDFKEQNDFFVDDDVSVESELDSNDKIEGSITKDSYDVELSEEDRGQQLENNNENTSTNNIEEDNSERTLDSNLDAFTQSHWETLDQAEKKKSIEALVDTLSDELGIEETPEVVFYNYENFSDYGGYDHSDNTIYVNEYNLGDGVETADTIAHETRHCWQHERAENPQTEQDFSFKENLENYITPEDDYQEYKDQPVERDAREYASDTCENIAADEPEQNDFLIPNNETKLSSEDVHDRRGAVFDDIKDISQDLNNKVNKVPLTKEVLQSLSESGLTKEAISDIRDLPKPSYKNGEVLNRDIHKPDPSSYLNDAYVDQHLAPFKETGCYRIQRIEPGSKKDMHDGVLGHESGLFVSSGADMISAFETALNEYTTGYIEALEDVLGMDRGSLGSNPVVIRINNPKNLRIPDGNEASAFPEYWIPGGFTSGNQPEAVIDSVPKGGYETMKFNNPNLLSWMKGDHGE